MTYLKERIVSKELLDSPIAPSVGARPRRTKFVAEVAAPVEDAPKKPSKMHKYKIYSHRPKGRGLFTQSDHFDVHVLSSPKPLEEFARGLSEKGFLVKAKGGSNYWVMPGAIMRVEMTA